MGTVSLVVEEIFPGDQMTEVMRRVRRFLQSGVQLIWLVDSGERMITVFRKGKELDCLDETEELTTEGLLPDLGFRVKDFFALHSGQEIGEEDCKRLKII
jgi:Uma2 family endonuclease